MTTNKYDRSDSPEGESPLVPNESGSSKIMTTPINVEERELEGLAMNIIHQAGDALAQELPEGIGHDYFVDARQSTNDDLIDFTKKLISDFITNRLIEELEGVEANGKTWEEPNEGTLYELRKRIATLRTTLSNTIEGGAK